MQLKWRIGQVLQFPVGDMDTNETMAMKHQLTHSQWHPQTGKKRSSVISQGRVDQNAITSHITGIQGWKDDVSSSKSGSSEARVDQMAFMTFSMKSRLTGVGERLESSSCSPAASKTYKTRMLLSCDPRSLHTRISLIILPISQGS